MNLYELMLLECRYTPCPELNKEEPGAEGKNEERNT